MSCSQCENTKAKETWYGYQSVYTRKRYIFPTVVCFKCKVIRTLNFYWTWERLGRSFQCAGAWVMKKRKVKITNF
jgi:hypothetical protein